MKANKYQHSKYVIGDALAINECSGAGRYDCNASSEHQKEPRSYGTQYNPSSVATAIQQEQYIRIQALAFVTATMRNVYACVQSAPGDTGIDAITTTFSRITQHQPQIVEPRPVKYQVCHMLEESS